MKTYTSISSWLRSKPSNEEIQKVLQVVNQKSKKEYKKALIEKKNELEKAKKLIANLERDIANLVAVVGEPQKRGARKPKENLV